VSEQHSSSPIASAGSSDNLVGSVVMASWWSCDALSALVLVFVGRPWSRVASAWSVWGVAASVDALAVAEAAVSSVDVSESAPCAGLSMCWCARQLLPSSSSLPTTAWPILCDSFGCSGVRTGSVIVDSTGSGGQVGLTSCGLLTGVARLMPSVDGDPRSFCPVPCLWLLHCFFCAVFHPSRPFSSPFSCSVSPSLVFPTRV
jgi:hypothetical protein